MRKELEDLVYMVLYVKPRPLSDTQLLRDWLRVDSRLRSLGLIRSVLFPFQGTEHLHIEYLGTHDQHVFIIQRLYVGAVGSSVSEYIAVIFCLWSSELRYQRDSKLTF